MPPLWVRTPAVLSWLLALALVSLAVLATAPAADARPTAVIEQSGRGLLGDPLGSNDWSCRPSAAHPTPVVLVHGTFSDRRLLLDRLSYRVHRAGYCVFSLDYGNRATGRIQDSARELSAYVDRVLAATGAVKVSLVGHSQGGMMPRYYLKYLGGQAKVEDLVGLAPSNHGTYTPALLNPLGGLCPACAQQARGSAFLTDLNRDDETPGEVSYTTVVTRYDAVIAPYTSGYLDGATNLRLQTLCRSQLVGHLGIPASGPAIRVVIHALNRRGPADPAFRPSCLP